MTRDEKNGRPRASAAPRRDGAAKIRPAKADTTPAETGDDRQRIAKLMARVGLCSRRDAESWILDGRVTVNGVVLTSPALDVGVTDVVLVDGEPLPAADKTRLFLFHKPSGLITSDHDPEGRETIFDYLRTHWPDGPRAVTVGRLDINTEGLLLLTNDGGLARILELPKTGWVRRYRVRAKGSTDQSVLDGLAHGVTIEGIEYAGIEAKLDRIQGANCWLTMGLREGKNREVKRVLEHIGLDVNRLIRLSFGPFQLLDLPEGHVEEVKTRILRDQLGPTLAAEAGVDFTEAEAVAPIVSGPKAAPKRSAGSKGAPARTGDVRGAKPAPRGRMARDPVIEPDVAPEIRERPVAGPRKHVSTIRAQTGTASRTGPRTRLERSDTTDRKNRKVAVERRVSATPEVEARTRPVRRPREDGPRERSDSPVRRERSESPARRERSESPARRERSESPARRERSESPARRERSESPARRERSDSPARRERSESPVRRERSESPVRRERSESPVRRERSESPVRRERSESPVRRERSESPVRRERSESPVRRERSESPVRRERSESPARRERSESPVRRKRSDSPVRRERAPEGRASQSALGKRERVARSGGEARAPRPERSFSDERPPRSTVSRGSRGDPADAPRGTRPAGKKTFGDRPSGGRPATGRVAPRGAAKPARGRERSSEDRPSGDRPPRGKPQGGKSFGERPARGRAEASEKRAPRADRPAGRGGAKPGRPPGGRPSGDGTRPPRKPR